VGTVLTIIALFMVPLAHAQVVFQQESETKPIELFKAAIDSPTGSIRTQVYGRLAQQVQQAVGAPGTPVFAEISTVKSFKEEGCKRLAMTLSTPQHLMKTSDGGAKPFAATWTLNVCRDGKPPAESIDLAKVGEPPHKKVQPEILPKAK
jgi:hypothetical protein